MKATRLITPTKKNFLIFAAAMMIFSVSTYAAKIDFLNSSVIPSARGTVKVKQDKFNNFILKIQLENLAEAGRLTPPKNTYVVWMVTVDQDTINIGQVQTSTGMFSKKLKAYLETKSSFRPVKIFITAEYDPNLQSTDSEVVMTTEFFTID
jgi:hypothetical protein